MFQKAYNPDTLRVIKISKVPNKGYITGGYLQSLGDDLPSAMENILTCKHNNGLFEMEDLLVTILKVKVSLLDFVSSCFAEPG